MYIKIIYYIHFECTLINYINTNINLFYVFTLNLTIKSIIYFVSFFFHCAAVAAYVCIWYFCYKCGDQLFTIYRNNFYFILYCFIVNWLDFWTRAKIKKKTIYIISKHYKRVLVSFLFYRFIRSWKCLFHQVRYFCLRMKWNVQMTMIIIIWKFHNNRFVFIALLNVELNRI